MSTSGDLSLLDQISRLGVVAFLVLGIFGFYRGWWVFGSAHKESVQQLEARLEEMQERVAILEKQSDAWMRTALKSTGIAETFAESLKGG